MEFNGTDPNYEQLRRVALHLKHVCRFYWAYGELGGDFLSMMTDDKKLIITYKPPNANPIDSLHLGLKISDLSSYDQFRKWILEHEFPLIREFSAENTFNLYESTLCPVLILYHDIEDTESVCVFYEMIKRELDGQFEKVQFVTANGSAPIHQLEMVKTRQKRTKPLVSILQSQNAVFYTFSGEFAELRFEFLN